MPTGKELIEQIAECSSIIAQKRPGNVVKYIQRREELRQKLAELPDLSFS